MDGWLVAIAALVALAVTLGVALRERRSLGGVRRAVGLGAGDPTPAVRALASRSAALEEARSAATGDLDRLLDGLAQGVLVVDDTGRIGRANPAAHGLLERGPGTLVGNSLMEAFLDLRVETLAREALALGTSSGEIAVAGADGPRLVLQARAAPDGRLWIVLDDVSELRRLQQIRAEFIDNLSHELRTPLTTVSLLAETLRRDATAAGDQIPARLRDRIDKIEVETGHLVQMVNELLDLSRIESGVALGVLDRLDLGQVAAESVERLRLFAERQGVTLEIERPASLATIRGDGARLAQVLVNLLHNAVKFSPDGGLVRVEVRDGAGEVVTSVTDHGVGIPVAAQARVFERFYKVDRARARGGSGGTGLGLAIARHIVEQHGGRIWVDSREGSGSTFSFAIPVAG